jgi:hypothetical protein
MAYQHLTDLKTISSVTEAQNKLYTIARESYFRDKTNKLETAQDHSIMLQSVFKVFKEKHQDKEYFQDGKQLFESPDFEKQLITQAKIGKHTRGLNLDNSDKLGQLLKQDTERISGLKSAVNHSILELTHHRGDIVQNMQKEILQVSANWGYSNQKDTVHVVNSPQFETKMRTELRSMMDATLTLRASQALLGKNVHALVKNINPEKESSIGENIKNLFGILTKTENKAEKPIDQNQLLREMENHKNRDFDRMFKSVRIEDIKSAALNAVKIVNDRNKNLQQNTSQENKKDSFLDKLTMISSKLLNTVANELLNVRMDEQQNEKTNILKQAVVASKAIMSQPEATMSYGLK